jgi:hypothetical protein
MIYIYKHTQDLIFAIEFYTYKAMARVTDFHEVIIKIYTTDIDDYVEASYKSLGNIYHNIVPQGDHDFIVINSEDLTPLDDGVLKMHIIFNMRTDYLEDRTYDESYDIETGFYLVNKRYDKSECKKCILIEDE